MVFIIVFYGDFFQIRVSKTKKHWFFLSTMAQRKIIRSTSKHHQSKILPLLSFYLGIVPVLRQCVFLFFLVGGWGLSHNADTADAGVDGWESQGSEHMNNVIEIFIG